jgi:ArsR family transcriptional regulator
MVATNSTIPSMELDDAANILAKIGNPTRLKIVRLLVRAGDDGLAVGQIQKQLDIPGSTLTHHIAHLKSAGIIRQQRQQATLICTIEYDLMHNLVDYLTAECCVDQATQHDVA